MQATRKFPPAVLVGLVFLLAIINSAAYYWHLYFHFPWLDIPMHFLGGLWVALYALAWYYGAPLLKKERGTLFTWMFALSVSMLVGLLWELFELSVDTIIAFSQHNLGDTLLDLVMDALGACVSAYIFLRGGYNR